MFQKHRLLLDGLTCYIDVVWRFGILVLM